MFSGMEQFTPPPLALPLLPMGGQSGKRPELDGSDGEIMETNALDEPAHLGARPGRTEREREKQRMWDWSAAHLGVAAAGHDESRSHRLEPPAAALRCLRRTEPCGGSVRRPIQRQEAEERRVGVTRAGADPEIRTKITGLQGRTLPQRPKPKFGGGKAGGKIPEQRAPKLSKTPEQSPRHIARRGEETRGTPRHSPEPVEHPAAGSAGDHHDEDEQQQRRREPHPPRRLEPRRRRRRLRHLPSPAGSSSPSLRLSRR